MKRIRNVKDLKIGKKYLLKKFKTPKRNIVKWLLIPKEINYEAENIICKAYFVGKGDSTFEFGEPEVDENFSFLDFYANLEKLWRYWELTDEEVEEYEKRLVLSKL